MDYDKNSLSNSNVNKARKEYFLNTCSDYSELRQSYNNTMLKNISINFGFPNTINTYKYKNSYPLTDIPLFEQRNIFYYDKDFQLFKNKSVSKYGEKKSKNSSNNAQNIRSNRHLSPQHKIITSIRKKKYVYDKDVENLTNFKKTEKDEKGEKGEKDIYELEVINQVLYDDDETDGKNKKNASFRELENEWGEIEQEIFEKEKDKKNNLLNSIYVEIEKENGDKQVKVLEITKEEKDKKEPCIKIRYSVEDKICLNPQPQNEPPSEEQISNFEKDSAFKSNNYKSMTNSISNYYMTSSIKRNDLSSLKKENVSEILLKESKSQRNFSTPSELSGSTSTNKFQKYSSKRDYYLSKEKDKKIDSIKPVMHRFEKEEISPIKERQISNEEVEEKNSKLIDIIKDEQEVEIKNKSIDMEDKIFIKEKEKLPEKEEKVEEITENKGRKMELIDKETNIYDKNIKGDKEDFISYEQKKYKQKEKNFFVENKEKIDEIKKEQKKEFIKPKEEETEINIKKETKEKLSIKDENEENGGFSRRFRVKEKETEEPVKQEIIYDRNKILKEKKNQEREFENEKAKKKESLSSFEENGTKKQIEIKKEKIEIKERNNLRDKYRNINRKVPEEEKDKNDLKVVSVDYKKNRFGNKYNNISNLKELNPDKLYFNKNKIEEKEDKYIYNFKNEEINTSKSQVLKPLGKTLETEKEKPDYHSKYNKKRHDEIEPKKENINYNNMAGKTYFYSRFGNKEENKDNEDENQVSKYRFGRNQNDILKEKVNIVEKRYGVEETEDLYNVDGRNQGLRRFYAGKESKQDNLKEKINKNEISPQVERHRYKTFQNKKQLQELKEREKEEKEEIKQIRRWGENQNIKDENLKKEKEREIEKMQKLKEKERLERERKEKEKRDLEKQIELMEKEKERIRIEKQREREKIKKEREESVRKERERIERERKEKERLERIERDKKEKEKKERQEKERIERERIENERRERERIENERRERERIEKERKERERLERERKNREESERKERERKESERKERERKERERLERERKNREESERKERERKERERKENEKKERERIERERERERKIREESERKEREKKERERKENERKERERLERERKNRAESERKEREKKERERKESERKERERLEKERKERERKEMERKERERKENERKERERLERERKNREESERKEREKKERERKEIERKEKQKLKTTDSDTNIRIKKINIENKTLDRNVLQPSKSLYDLAKYKIDSKPKIIVNKYNISEINIKKDKDKNLVTDYQKNVFNGYNQIKKYENSDSREYNNKTYISKYNKEKKIDIDLSYNKDTQKANNLQKFDAKNKIDQKPKIKQEIIDVRSRSGMNSSEKGEKIILTNNYNLQGAKVQKNEIKPVEKIKVNRDKFIGKDFAKEKKNKDTEKKKSRYTSLEVAKQPNEMKLIENRLKDNKHITQNIRTLKGEDSYESIIYKNKVITKGEEKQLRQVKSIQNLHIDKKAKHPINLKQPEKNLQNVDIKIISNISKNNQQIGKMDSQFNIYKRGVAQNLYNQKEKDYKNLERTFNSQEKVKSEKEPIGQKPQKSYQIPVKQNINQYNQKTEIRPIQKIYTKYEPPKTDERFASKTYKVQPKNQGKIQNINYYKIPESINIGFTETKTTRSQEKISPYEENEFSRTLKRGKKRDNYSLNEKDFVLGIKERIKEKYLFNDIEEDNERKERELDLERIDREITIARERVEKQRQKSKKERIERERPEKERKERERREKSEREERERKLKLEKERAERERIEREKKESKEKERIEREKKRKEYERIERERKESIEKERIERENKRKEFERIEREKREKMEKEKKEKELEREKERIKKEKEKAQREKEEKERREKMERERKERELEKERERAKKEKEKAERERKEKMEKERKEKELERERERAQKEREKAERERQEKIERERKEKELERERAQKEREKAERERQEKIERERKEREMEKERERIKREKEKAERERQEKLEKERKEKELERERIKRERIGRG